jgi:hypothetical protein
MQVFKECTGPSLHAKGVGISTLEFHDHTRLVENLILGQEVGLPQMEHAQT